MDSASEEEEPIPSCHVVAVPYPGRGHINALMNLCRLLASSNPAQLLISFVLTEEWLGFLGGSAAEPPPIPNLRLRSIPNVLPSEKVRGADFPGFIAAVYSRMEGPFEELLDRLEPQAGFILADALLSSWALEVGSRRDIPVASFWPMSASAFSAMFHFHLLVSNGHFPFDVSERGDERVDYIPISHRISVEKVKVSAGQFIELSPWHPKQNAWYLLPLMS